MKALCAFILVLFFSIYILAAQAANLAEKEPDPAKDKKATQTKKSDDTKTNPASKSKVVIPPEKAKPIKIPKIETPPTIDGKPDEETWKLAAVFKDFYQTS